MGIFNYFNGVKTSEEANKRFMKLAMQNHPDRIQFIRPDLFKDGVAILIEEVERVKAGMNTIMQVINAEFKLVKEALLRDELSEKKDGYFTWVGKTYTGVHDSESYFKWSTDRSQDIIDAVNKIIHIKGIEIEIIKFWVWVGGDTKPVKEILKAAGFTWHGQKSMWVFKTCKALGHFQTIEQVRSYHGSTKVDNEDFAPAGMLVGAVA